MTVPEETTARGEVSVAADGRVTIPSSVRRVVGVEPGDSLLCYSEQGRIVFEDRAHLLARIQAEARAAREQSGHTGSAVDELIADRRAETAREDVSPNATIDDPYYPAPGRTEQRSSGTR